MATKNKKNSEIENTSWTDLVFKTIKERANKSKEGFLEVLAKEVSSFLGKLNVSEEITKALKGLIINFSASVEFQEKKGKGLHPKTTIHSATVDKE